MVVVMFYGFSSDVRFIGLEVHNTRWRRGMIWCENTVMDRP